MFDELHKERELIEERFNSSALEVQVRIAILNEKLDELLRLK